MERFLTLFRYLLAGLAFFPLLCWGNGTYIPGTVAITTDTSGNVTGVTGAFNVRFNGAVSKGSIYIAGAPGTLIIVSGTASTGNASFLCLSTPGDAIYSSLEKILLAAGDGTQIIATRDITTSRCTYVSITQSSERLQ